MNRRIAFHTLGCRLNQAETAALQHAFESSGSEIIPFGEPCDVVVINTCTVTANGDSDTRRLVNRIHRRQPDVRIALIGCQAQLQADDLVEWPGVRWVVGTAEKMQLPLIIAEDAGSDQAEIRISEISKDSFRMPAPALDRFHTRANLKIQDGCNFFCSYCEIPYARGRSRSREYDDILAEAKVLVGAGHPEIILTGINVGCYSFEEKVFLDVVEGLLEVDGLMRLRVSSIEPTTTGVRLLELMAANPILCRHLHLPLQSGCDSVLKRMNRRYDVSEYKAFMELAYHTVPDACLGADVMVGFPAETDEEFERTREFIDGLPLSYLHVFSYSPRNHAKASRMGLLEVDGAVKKRRSAVLRRLGEEKRRRFMEGYVGHRVAVLAEQEKGGAWNGLTDNFIRVHFSAEEDVHGQFVTVMLESVNGSSMTGTRIYG